MVPKNILASCREYLRSYHIFVNEKWLNEAMEYFMNDLGEGNMQKVYINVKKQWYLHDLAKTSSGCLPQNLKALRGHYMLQIDCITSFEIFSEHKQFLTRFVNIKKKMDSAAVSQDMRNLEDKMLQLYMTDGVQEVIGIVLRPITNLYITTVPGVKVLVKGPVRSYGSFLLLSNDNCQLLGGEVEHLLSENYEPIRNLMELVKMHSIQTDISRHKSANSIKNEEIQSVNQLIIDDMSDSNNTYKLSE